MPLALQRHATSKIERAEDLSALHSLGFRGEALASIASVARVTLRSRWCEAPQAMELVFDPQTPLPTIFPAAHPEGTVIDVRDLFFNTPVRRKFLRSDKTEFDHAAEIFRRLALSHFSCGFSLQHDERRVLQCPPALTPEAKLQRVTKICGTAFTQFQIF